MTLSSLLLALVASTHLAAVGLATLGPLWCIWLSWYERRCSFEAAGNVARRLAGHSTAGLTAGMGLGGLLLIALWLAPDGGFFQAARLIPPSRFWFGAVEAAFSLVCLAVYWLWWPSASRGRLARCSHAAIAFLGATNLAYHFPTLFAVTGLYAAQPELAAGGFRQAMLHPEVPARAMHFLLAATIFSGLWVCRLVRALPPDMKARRVAAAVARVVLGTCVLQMISGAALLGVLAAPARDALMGGSPAATVLLGLSVLGTVLLLHWLASMSLGGEDPGLTVRAVWLVLGIILLMCAARQLQRARQAVADGNTPGRLCSTPCGAVAARPRVVARGRGGEFDQNLLKHGGIGVQALAARAWPLREQVAEAMLAHLPLMVGQCSLKTARAWPQGWSSALPSESSAFTPRVSR